MAGFLRGLAQTLDLQPAAAAFNTARRRREDRKQTIEDRDHRELLGARRQAATVGIDLGAGSTLGENMSAFAGYHAPGGGADHRAAVDKGFKSPEDRSAYLAEQRDYLNKTQQDNYESPEQKRAREREARNQINTAALKGYDIADGEGGVDRVKYQEMIADIKRKDGENHRALIWSRTGVSQQEQQIRRGFIKTDLPSYVKELNYYLAGTEEWQPEPKVVANAEALLATIKRLEDGGDESVKQIRDALTKVRISAAEGYSNWRGEQAAAGVEIPSHGMIAPGEGPLRPDHMPASPGEGSSRLEEWRSNDITTSAPTTPAPTAPTGETTPSISSGETPGLGETKPPTPAAPAPGATPPADPAYGALFDETHFGIEKVAGNPEGTATQDEKHQDWLGKQGDLQIRYRNKDLSLQSRYYNPGSLMLNTMEQGRDFGWEGLVGIDERGFAQFESAEAGVNALKQQLRVDRNKIKEDGSPLTVADFVKKYVGEGADPGGTKNALKNVPKLLGDAAPQGLETPIKDIDMTALLRAVITNENHDPDSLSVFEPYIEEGRDLKSEVQSPGENPLMDQGGGLGETSPAKAFDVRKMDQGALVVALDGGGLDWDTLSPEDKAWIQKNHKDVYDAMMGKE